MTDMTRAAERLLAAATMLKDHAEWGYVTDTEHARVVFEAAHWVEQLKLALPPEVIRAVANPVPGVNWRNSR